MKFYIPLKKSAGKTMIYGNMPMMIFILAAGYLFTVYLLLALAKRTGKNLLLEFPCDQLKETPATGDQ